MIGMEEKNPIQPKEEVQDAALDQVAGGIYSRTVSVCPNCGKSNEAVWSYEKNMYVCPSCGVKRSTSIGVQIVV